MAVGDDEAATAVGGADGRDAAGVAGTRGLRDRPGPVPAGQQDGADRDRGDHRGSGQQRGEDGARPGGGPDARRQPELGHPRLGETAGDRGPLLLPPGAQGGVDVVLVHPDTSRSGRSRARASDSVDFTVPAAQPMTSAHSATGRPTT